MTKCLVTKLNGSVTNQDLPIYDCVRIKFNNEDVETQTAKNSSIVFGSNDEDGPEITCEKGYFTDSTFTQNLGTYKKMSYGGYRLYVSKGASILAKGKQKITKISFDDGAGDDANKVIHWDDIVGCNSLKQLLVSGDIQGSIRPLLKAKLNYFQLINTDFPATVDDIVSLCDSSVTVINVRHAAAVSGDVSKFGSLTGLTGLFTEYSQVAGSVESLAESFFNNGKRSGSFCITTGDRISYEGQYHGNYGYTVSMKFSDEHVECNIDRGTPKYYDGTSWS